MVHFLSYSPISDVHEKKPTGVVKLLLKSYAHSELFMSYMVGLCCVQTRKHLKDYRSVQG